MDNLHPVMRSALAPFAPAYRAPRQPEGYDDEMEEGCCAVCNGSGEGQHEGTRCYSCKGSGTDWYPVKKSSSPDEDDDEDFDGAPA